MRKIEAVLAALVMAAVSTTAIAAEMPKELKGSWILNAEATTEYMKTSPKWDEATAKHLPMIIKRMSKLVYLFEDDVITVSMRGKGHALPVVLKSTDKKTYVFEAKAGKRVITLTVSINDAGNLNIRSSATDDMDYYLWKRGELAKE